MNSITAKMLAVEGGNVSAELEDIIQHCVGSLYGGELWILP